MTGTHARRAPGNAVDIANLAVIIDPTSTKQPALAKALALATQFGAAVTLLSFDTKQLRGLRLAKKSPWRNHLPNYASVQSWLNHFAIPLRARGIEVATQLVDGDPADDSLLCWLQQSDVDLVLKDVRQASQRQMPLTDTDWRLLRFCPMPLLLGKPRQWQDSPIVVAAVDPLHGSDPNALLDHEIMAYATYVVNRLSGKLHVFHAPFPAASATTAVAGVPDTHLPRVAMEHNANIVVMGALAHSRTTSPDIGRTAESVFESLPCDVLVIKSPLAS
jgi:universal stress protein E